jgi:long-chain acyl-CoA synthetase
MPDTEIRVVDPVSRPDVAPGRDGERLARGPQIMAGYSDSAIDTADAFEDDWLRTGDLGHLDERGNVVIVDRHRNLIKVNALRVAPKRWKPPCSPIPM